MASPDYKVVLHRKEHEPPDQVHDVWYFGMPRIYNRYDRYIVTPELKAFHWALAAKHGGHEANELLKLSTSWPHVMVVISQK